MSLTFNIQYFTTPGEYIAIEMLVPTGAFFPMVYNGEGMWTLTVDIDSNAPSVSYRYVVMNNDMISRREWGQPHSVDITADSITLYDRWQDVPANKPLYSQAITECLNKRDERQKPVHPLRGHILMSIEAPMVTPDETVVMAGSCPALGNWNPALAPEMNHAKFPTWQLNIDMSQLPPFVEYKMVIVKSDTRKVVKWEEGENRRLLPCQMDKDSANIYSGLRFNSSSYNIRAGGVAIPVFSLRSHEDWGIGDFYDMKLMIDWAVATGMKFVQILPINDTTMSGTWTDSYPYNANSTYALNPIYLRPTAMGKLKDAERMAYYTEQAMQLNDMATIDYVAVSRLKLAYTHELFDQDEKTITRSLKFKKFINSNAYWLKPYAAFCVLRDMHSTARFADWGEYATYDAELIDKFIKEHSREINFVYFQQYNLDKQLREVHQYARERHIAIKGDIPIGISPTSVDAWTLPRLFNLDCQAGAPPDDFSVLGQNWGFPTYNWEHMSQDKYSWWKARFVKMAEYFDAYRIDHVLGFFRIWEIPCEAVHGLLGYFNPALPLTVGEMLTRFNFPFNPGEHTHPLISDRELSNLKPEIAFRLKEQYLQPGSTTDTYLLRHQYSTQLQVMQHFNTLDDNETNRELRDVLMNFIDNVLFIEDPRQKGMYHPRISANQTSAYKALSDAEQWQFDQLYEDFYYHRHNRFWHDNAMKKLPALTDATTMLTCAEDLGMIPGCVPQVMNNLQILSLEIQRMPKEFGLRVGRPEAYPYLSVCTTSTHDMGGIRQWWEEENNETIQSFYNHELGHQGTAPAFAEPQLCEEIIKMNLNSPSMLSILPWQDWMSMSSTLRRVNPREEQINNPACSRHYWRYRMHLALEELLRQTDFNDKIKRLNKESNRC